MPGMKRGRSWIFVVVVLLVGNVVSQAQPTAFEEVFAIEEPIALRGDATFPLYAPGNSYVTRDRIYVPDLQQNQVALFDHAGRRIAAVGRPGQGPGEFQMPYGMRPGAASQIYVYERGNLRIQVFDDELNPRGILATPVQGDQIFPAAYDGTQHVIVTGLSACGMARCLVRVYDANGQRIRELAPLEGDPVMKTWQAAIHDGDIFIVNIYEGIVRQYDLAGGLTSTLPLSSPSALYYREEAEAPQTRSEFSEQLQATTQQPLSVIRGLFVHDGRLFVQMENRNRPDAEAKYFLDVYDVNGTLQMHGIVTPGLLRSVTDRFYFVDEQQGEDAFGRMIIHAARLRF